MTAAPRILTVCEKCGRFHARMRRRTCRAHRRDGSPCMNFPVGGSDYGTVCRMHSGTKPSHVYKRERGRAMTELEGMLSRAVQRHMDENPPDWMWIDPDDPERRLSP